VRVDRLRPRDTSSEAWDRQRAAFRRMGPEGRVRAAVELSKAVRAIQLEGILSRNPGWSERDAVRHLVATLHGVELPRDP
jgi:hypothetical protein